MSCKVMRFTIKTEDGRKASWVKCGQVGAAQQTTEGDSREQARETSLLYVKGPAAE